MRKHLRLSVYVTFLSLQAPVVVFGAPTIVVDDTPVMVFQHTQRCEPMDLPDAPLRAFRRADGMVVAFATHYLNRGLVGRSLTQLSHDCQLTYQGLHLADPAKFDDRTWITATWTADGINVTALGHNEYQGEKFPGICRYTTTNECGYYSIVPLSSVNGGRSFVRTDYPEPIAAPSTGYNEEQGIPRGYLSPSNIIFFHDYYYALIARSAAGKKPAGRCLFRTADVMAPQKWTAWDGDSYIPIFGSPYDQKWVPTPLCQSVTGLNGYLGSIAKIQGAESFVAFTLAESGESLERGFVDISFSTDLLHWSGSQHVLSVTPAWSRLCPKGERYSYPAVLSDSDGDRNFETIGRTAWLFITKISCLHPLDRDLVRFPVTFSPGEPPSP